MTGQWGEHSMERNDVRGDDCQGWGTWRGGGADSNHPGSEQLETMTCVVVSTGFTGKGGWVMERSAEAKGKRIRGRSSQDVCQRSLPQSGLDGNPKGYREQRLQVLGGKQSLGTECELGWAGEHVDSAQDV